MTGNYLTLSTDKRQLNDLKGGLTLSRFAGRVDFQWSDHSSLLCTGCLNK